MEKLKRSEMRGGVDDGMRGRKKGRGRKRVEEGREGVWNDCHGSGKVGMDKGKELRNGGGVELREGRREEREER